MRDTAETEKAAARTEDRVVSSGRAVDDAACRLSIRSGDDPPPAVGRLLAGGHVDPPTVLADRHAVDPEPVAATPQLAAAAQVVGEQPAAGWPLVPQRDVE